MQRTSPAAAILLALLAATPAGAQRPVQPYDVSGSHRTFHLVAQLTGPLNRGRDLMLSSGVVWPDRGGGGWMAGIGGAGGVTTGANVVERALAGPQLTLTRAFRSQHFEAARGSRAEPYLIGTAGAYGVADFSAGEQGFAPAVAGGIGMRVFGDEWDVSLSVIELTVEKRFGFRERGAELYIRLGNISPRRGRAAARAPAALPRPGG